MLTTTQYHTRLSSPGMCVGNATVLLEDQSHIMYSSFCTKSISRIRKSLSMACMYALENRRIFRIFKRIAFKLEVRVAPSSV